MKKYIKCSQSSIARQVAEYVLPNYDDTLAEIEKSLLAFDATLPVNLIIQNIQDIIYKKFFNYYRKTQGNQDFAYGLPPTDLDSCLADADEWWPRYVTLCGIVKTRHGEIIIDVCTQFVDYYTDSYYVLYDCNTGNADLQKSTSGEYNSKRGREDVWEA